MGQQNVALAAAAILLLHSSCARPLTGEGEIRELLSKRSMGVIRLPAGDVEITSPLRLPAGTAEMEIRGSGSTRIVASPRFQGPALFIVEKGKNITFADFVIDGNRDVLAKPAEMAPPENAFRVWYSNNGILADQVEGLNIERVEFHNVVNFAVLASRSSGVHIAEARVERSGSLNAQGRNNTTGGIVLEEGTSGFEVRNSFFKEIRGNALWTHSLLTSPQLSGGVFAGNRFETIGRDAIQVGHAQNVKVENNTGREIGYPFEIVDAEHGGTPVAIDTAGDVSGTEYARNRFDEINGKCIDLDGFHDGTVVANICINRGDAASYPHGHFGIVMNNSNPATHSDNIVLSGNWIDGAKYGGLFAMGSNNRILNNRFENLNLARCNEGSPACLYKPDEPDMLQSGIYVGLGVARLEPAAGNEIRGNIVAGHRISAHCIVFGPGVAAAANAVASNQCRDAASK